MYSNGVTHRLIKAGTLVDGNGGQPKKDMAILVENSTIVQVDHVERIRVPDGVTFETCEFPDATLLPGLVDCHTHTNMPGDGTSVDDVGLESYEIHILQGVKQAKLALESGVTTMRDNGGWHRSVFWLKEGIRRDLVVGPRILASGRPITMTGGHCWMMGSVADGVAEVRAAVRELVWEGADFIKVMATGGSTIGSMSERPSYTLEELQAITDEAHRRGRLVGAHTIAQKGIENALDAGVNMLIHCTFVQPDGSISYDPKVGERIASTDTWVNPTIHVRRGFVDLLEQKRTEDGLTPEEEADLVGSVKAVEDRVKVTSQLIKDGAKVIGGSDCGWHVYEFGMFHKELETLVMSGMSHSDALLAGTREAAKALGVSDIVGTLEVGKEADLLLTNGDPTENISHLQNVVGVFKSGIRVK